MFCYSDPIWIYNSLAIDCFAEALDYSMCLAFIASSFRVTEEYLLFETDVWPTFFLLSIFTALRGALYIFIYKKYPTWLFILTG